MTNSQAPVGTAQAEATKVSPNGALLIRIDLGSVPYEIELAEVQAKLPLILQGLADQIRPLWPDAKTSMEFDETLRRPWSQQLLLTHFKKCLDAMRAQSNSSVTLGGVAAAACSLTKAASSEEIS